MMDDSSLQLKALHQKLGKCVDKSRPYYDALKDAKLVIWLYNYNSQMSNSFSSCGNFIMYYSYYICVNFKHKQPGVIVIFMKFKS